MEGGVDRISVETGVCDMKITDVHYRRVFNLGNYETVTVELTAAVNDGEDTQSVIDALAAEALEWRKRKAQEIKDRLA